MINGIGADQIQQLLTQFLDLFLFLLLAPVQVGSFPLLLLITDITERFGTEGPVEDDNKNSVSEIHGVTPDDVQSTEHKSGKCQDLEARHGELRQDWFDFDEDEGEEDEEVGTDDIPNQVGFDQLDHSDSEQILALQEVEQRVGDHEDDAVHEEQDVVTREYRLRQFRVRVVRVRHLQQG